MEIIFPSTEDISFQGGNVVFEALVDGEPVGCLVTARALCAAAGVDNIIPRIEAFKIGRDTIHDVVTCILRRARTDRVVVTWAELAMSSRMN